MEHPILFLNLLFEKLGLPVVASASQAHSFEQFLLLPHVTYTWVVMILLFVLGGLAAKRLEMVPKGGQNFFETVIILAIHLIVVLSD